MSTAIANPTLEVQLVAGVIRSGADAADLLGDLPATAFTRGDLADLWQNLLPNLHATGALNLPGAVMSLAPSGNGDLAEELATPDPVPVSTLRSWAETLRKLAYSRAIHGAVTCCASMVERNHRDPGLTHYELVTALEDAAACYAPVVDAPMADSLYAFDRWRDKLIARRSSGRGLCWGLADLDRRAELWPSLGLILGRTNHGKTQLACQLALAQSQQGTAAVVFSLEQPREQLVCRLLCLLAGLPWQSVMGRDELTAEQAEALASSRDWLRSASCLLTIVDGKLSTEHIISRIRRLQQAGRCDIAYIDQMSRIEHHRQPREHIESAWARTSNRLSRAWQDLSLPIVLLAQLNIKQAEDHTEPSVSQVKQCGAMGEDACWVLIVDRPEAEPLRMQAYEKSRAKCLAKADYEGAAAVDMRGKVRLIMAKDRNRNMGGNWIDTLPFNAVTGQIGTPAAAASNAPAAAHPV